MDLSNPMQSVAPGAHAAVLGVLARTEEPLSGSRVAALTRPGFSTRRVNDVLGELSRAGLVTRQSAPPAYLYRLNREHVAADGIIALAGLGAVLLDRMRSHIVDWELTPVAAWLFGSAARGEAGLDSDIDVLLVPPSDRREESTFEATWARQTGEFVERVRAWSGNHCELLELEAGELAAAVDRDERLVRDLRDHALVLAGPHPRTLLRKTVGR